MRSAIRSPAQLALGSEDRNAALAGHRLFPLRIPAEWEDGVRTNPALARQVVPLAEESRRRPGYLADAVGDLPAMVAPGVIHKYHGRVLLITTGACALHCRYCFRRHFPYGEATAARGNWQDALRYLRKRPDVAEVILSGGDPLMLETSKLAELTHRLEDIPTIRRLRLHTRMPTVVPSRVDDALSEWLQSTRLQRVLVLHVNHPDELTRRALQAIARLRTTGVTLLNQAVLLAGVNDDAQVLADLSEALFAGGVLPYYLHLLDRVEGAGHFDVPENRARALMDELRARLSGFLVPRLVREQAGAPYKLPVL